MAFSPADRPKKIVTFARLEYVYRSICVQHAVKWTESSWQISLGTKSPKNLHFCPANNIATNGPWLGEATFTSFAVTVAKRR